MTHSLAEQPTLTCPACGQPFTPDIWLILDAAERPDLLARAREGAIHQVVCPNGHAGEVDAPLLVYRPGAARPLLFSPARRTTAEQDREIAGGLLRRLAASLGGAWREAWLESVAIVPREALPAVLGGVDPETAAAEALGNDIPPGVQAALAEIAAALAAEGVVLASPEELARALDERPALRARLDAAVGAAEGGTGPGAELLTDPLTATLRAYVETPDWIASYRFLLEHPELLTDAADEQLARLVEAATTARRELTANAFAEHRDLLRRARAVGAARAYADKLGTTPERLEEMAASDPVPPAARQVFEEVMAALRAEGVSVTSPEEFQAALAARPALAARLAAAVGAAAEEAGDEDEAGETAAAPLHPLLAALQAFVQAETWLASYQYVIDHPELLTDAADAALAQGVNAATAAGDTDAVQFYGEHLALLRRAREIGVAPAFAEKLGTTAEQLEAAALGQGSGGPDVPPHYRADVQRANEAAQRYQAIGDRAALDEAAAAWQHVLNDPGFAAAPERFQLAALNDAAIVFIRRYQVYGRLADLDHALALWQDAVARTPADAPDRAAIQNNLGNGLSARYARTGQLADLTRAIEAYEDAVARTPADAPDRAGYQNNLGTGLRARYARTGQLEDLDAALAHCRAAARAAATTAGEVALRAARAWAGLALRRGVWAEARAAAEQGAATLARLYQANVLTAERASWLKEAQGQAAAGAYARARLGDAAGAAVALEAGQARGLNAALGRGRDRALLERLSRDDEALFAAYEDAAGVRRALEGVGGAGARPDGAPAEDPAARRRRVEAAQAALDAVIARIQARPGYETLFAAVAFADIAAAVLPGRPLAYLATTDAGSLLLLLREADGAAVAEAHFAGLTVDELDRLLVRRAVAAGNVGEIEGGLLPAQVSGIGLGRELDAALPLLGERLMAPLAARLRALGATAVTLIPGGRLNLLPLHAASYEAEGAARVFLDEFAVAYAPSAQSAGASRERAGRLAGGAALVVGNPQPVHPPLRYAREEAEGVAGLFPGRATPLYETDATLAAVRDALPGQAVFHFAGHGIFDPDDPLASGLVLAGAARLTLGEVQATAAVSQARLVVLSACQTGLTDFRELPDEVVGLPAGFLVAGAAGVVGSLWPVDDRSTALLMVAFHRRVLDGAAPAEALRAAQRWLRGVTWGELDAHYSAFLPRLSLPAAEAAQLAASGHNPQEAAYPDPRHWAAFTYTGALP